MIPHHDLKQGLATRLDTRRNYGCYLCLLLFCTLSALGGDCETMGAAFGEQGRCGWGVFRAHTESSQDSPDILTCASCRWHHRHPESQRVGHEAHLSLKPVLGHFSLRSLFPSFVVLTPIASTDRKKSCSKSFKTFVEFMYSPSTLTR